MKTPAVEPTHARVALELKHPSPLIGCRFDPSGRFLFVSAQDNSIQRWDLATGRKTALAGHASWVRGMAFAGGGGSFSISHVAVGGLAGSIASAIASRSVGPYSLISGDYHGTVRWWDGATETPVVTRTVSAHDGWVRAVAIQADGRLLATCGNDHLVKLWSCADGKPVRTLEGHGCHVYNVAFHPNGKTIASADLKGTVKEWEVESGKHLRDLDAKAFHKYDTAFAADIGGVRGMSFSPDGSTLACAGITNVSNAFAGVGNPLVLLFDMKDGKAKQLKPKDAFQGTGWGVGFLPNGSVVAAGGAGQGRIWFWKPEDPANPHTVNVPSNARDMAVHPDGTAVAVAGANGTTYVYTLTPSPPAAKKETPPSPKKK